ncbi:MAG: amidohydrolase family protein [Oscillospiraceae bacterium]
MVISHAEDMTISKYDYRLAENIETARNILLCEYYGANLHMAHVSTKESIAYIQNAKENGVNVTCEVTPHHLYFYDNPYKVNPPIREKADVTALIKAIKKGYIDCISTDHAPHTTQDKQKGAAGMVGLETAFGAVYKVLVAENGIPLAKLSAMLSDNPSKLLGLNKGKIKVGYDGDIVLADVDKKWTVDSQCFASRSNNTAFEGETLQGKIMLTVKNGKITFKDENFALK